MVSFPPLLSAMSNVINTFRKPIKNDKVAFIYITTVSITNTKKKSLSKDIYLFIYLFDYLLYANNTILHKHDFK